jgi:arylsulfatase A-like enzyme
MPSYERLISRIFADAGYHCGLAGKLHLSSCANHRVEQRIDDGYQEFYWSHHPQPDWPENAYSQWLAEQGVSWQDFHTEEGTPYVKPGPPAHLHQTTWCAGKTIDFLTRNAGRPWFFSFNCFDPHHPFDPPREYLDRYDPDQMPLPKYKPGELNTKPEYQKLDHVWAHNEPGYFDVGSMTDSDRREVTAACYAMCELIDDQFGRIMDALESTGQLENTLVIFMSDHGEMLGDHGLYLKGPHFYEEAVHVPLVMSCPGLFQEGLEVHAMVELLDIAPTLCDAAGIPYDSGFQGRSLYPICTGAADPSIHRDAVYSEYYNAWTHHRSYGTMLRTATQKIVVYHATGQGELYDLENDPDEFENLWDTPKAAPLKLELMQRCFDASVLSMDPLPERLGPF